MKIKNYSLEYLQLLAEKFPSAVEAATEIINLEAILSLPKGTEHFLADIHGEYEAFDHVLKNASGSIKRKVDELFGAYVRQDEKRELCTLIYYPKEMLEQVHHREENIEEWYPVILNKLIQVCKKVSEKYTRSKVRKSLPKQYSYIIQELLHEDAGNDHKSAYYHSIFKSIIETGKAEDFIIALCQTIQRLVIDHLHVVGDIYDRGPGAHHVMDTLSKYHNFDIQWGNHDMLWMGAACGNAASMANVLRVSLRYANLNTLEEGYGINLLPLARFAMETYANDECKVFRPKLGSADKLYDENSAYLIAQMHKAISVIQFKLEHEIISRHPEYGMEDRNLLHKMDLAAKTITLPDGKSYPLLDTNFPTIDPKDPYKLSDKEKEIVERLLINFRHSEKLQKHIDILYKHGSMYLSYNGNLLYHASIPMNEDKTFRALRIGKTSYSGKALYDKIDSIVREARVSSSVAKKKEKQMAIDFMWYLWCGPDSPLFDKSAMTTLERYLVEDKATHHEQKGYYFVYRKEEEVCIKILEEFGLSGPDSHIINGHVPVKAVKGEQPIQAGGRMMLIDGGFSKAYQKSTGIAGYTLIFNSHGLHLIQHEPFCSTQRAIEKMEDIQSSTVLKAATSHRIYVRDTDNGKVLRSQIDALKALLEAYKYGKI